MKADDNGTDWFLHFKNGDRHAFQKAFDLHYRSVLYFASSILQQDSYAEDIVVDSFEKAWRNKDRLATPRHLENFLYLVTRNSCISFLRSNRVYRSASEEWLKLTDDVEGPDQCVDLERLKARFIERLHYHLERLNGGEVLRMAFLEGKSTQEIAQQLNISENNVYIIKSRTIKALRTILTKEASSFTLFFLLIFLCE